MQSSSVKMIMSPFTLSSPVLRAWERPGFFSSRILTVRSAFSAFHAVSTSCVSSVELLLMMTNSIVAGAAWCMDFAVASRALLTAVARLRVQIIILAFMLTPF